MSWKKRYENKKETHRTISIMVKGKRMGVFDTWQCAVCKRKFLGHKNLKLHKDKEHRY